VDEAEHRAQDADGRAEASGDFPNLRHRHFFALLVGDGVLDQIFKHFGVVAVDDVTQVRSEESVFHRGQLLFEGKDAFLAGHGRHADDLLDQDVKVDFPVQKNFAHGADGSTEVADLTRQERRSQRAAEHDEGRRRLEERFEVATFPVISQDDGGKSEDQAEHCSDHWFSPGVIPVFGP
jgi:hypothetical protein